MISRRKHHFFYIAAIIMGVSGCALNEQMRTPAAPDTKTSLGQQEEELRADRGKGAYDNIEYYTVQDPDPKHPERHYSHTTAYVEFDEQGDFFDRGQLLSAVQAAPKGSKRLLFFYVHGWQNNTRSNDVVLFNRFLAHLSRSLNEPTPPNESQPWEVYGVYLSWRGGLYEASPYEAPRHQTLADVQPEDKAFQEDDLDPVTAGATLLRYTTFWTRQAAAGRFAGGPLLETIQTISNKVRRVNPGDTVGTAQLLTRTILMGHSFGAYIIEKTLLGSMPTQEVRNTNRILPPVDLVVLLNSAAPAIYAKEFVEYMKWHSVGTDEPPMPIAKKRIEAGGAIANEKNASSPRPFIVSITSEADWATKDTFPIGTIPGTIFDVGSYQGDDSISFRNANEKLFFTHTPGHSPYLVSHNVVPNGKLWKNAFDTSKQKNLWILKGNLEPSSFGSSPGFPVLGENEILLWGDNGYGKEGRDSFPQVWAIRPSTPASDQPAGSKPYNNTAYWILRVPRQIIADHNDVWNPNTANLIAGVFRMAGLVPKADPKNAHSYTAESYKLRILYTKDLADPGSNYLTKCADYPEDDPNLN